MSASKSYTNYFRQLAVRHHKLQHDPATETGDGIMGQKRFGRFSAEDVVTGLKSKMDWPALMIEMYERKTVAGNAYAIGNDFFGAFSIVASANPQNANQVDDAYDLAEEIMNDIITQIWQDHHGQEKDRCKTPFKMFNFDGMSIMPFGPIWDQQFGWRCEFQFKFNYQPEYTTPPADGVFLPTEEEENP